MRTSLRGGRTPKRSHHSGDWWRTIFFAIIRLRVKESMCSFTHSNPAKFRRIKCRIPISSCQVVRFLYKDKMNRMSADGGWKSEGRRWTGRKDGETAVVLTGNAGMGRQGKSCEGTEDRQEAEDRRMKMRTEGRKKGTISMVPWGFLLREGAGSIRPHPGPGGR